MGTINFETSRDPVALFSLARTKPESGAAIGTFSLRKLETIPSFHIFSFSFFFSLSFYFRPVLSLKQTTNAGNGRIRCRIVKYREEIYIGKRYIFFFEKDRRKNISVQHVK